MLERNNPAFRIKDSYSFEELLLLIEFLRGPNGCPWDREQTHQSLRQNLIEEAYEVVDAIDSGRPERIADELGDYLLQVVLQAQIAEEAGEFNIAEVLRGLCVKLISRHTHLFGDDVAKDATESLATWERNKKTEKGQKTEAEVLQGVPSSFPALTRAYKIQKKAAHCGFDWNSVSGAQAKIGEELAEFVEAYQLSSSLEGKAAALAKDKVEEEGGDLLFAVVNTLRHAGVEPEVALNRSNEKFIRRFAAMEAKILERGAELRELQLAEMDQVWDEVKAEEKAQCGEGDSTVSHPLTRDAEV